MQKLSIITVNLNNAIGLRKTIESVVNQTFTDFEYIIIDGGSTDGSVDVIREYSEKITYWVNEPDKGIYNAMNKGIKIAKGEYLQFLNSGDFLIDNRVLKSIFDLERNEDVLYGEAVLGDNLEKKIKFPPSPKIIDHEYFWTNTLTHQSTLIKRTLFNR